MAQWQQAAGQGRWVLLQRSCPTPPRTPTHPHTRSEGGLRSLPGLRPLWGAPAPLPTLLLLLSKCTRRTRTSAPSGSWRTTARKASRSGVAWPFTSAQRGRGGRRGTGNEARVGRWAACTGWPGRAPTNLGTVLLAGSWGRQPAIRGSAGQTLADAHSGQDAHARHDTRSAAQRRPGAAHPTPSAERTGRSGARGCRGASARCRRRAGPAESPALAPRGAGTAGRARHGENSARVTGSACVAESACGRDTTAALPAHCSRAAGTAG